MRYIDLTENKNLQTIVDKEEGEYLGHVTTAVLEDDKTIFAVYPKSHGRGTIILKKSCDCGETWGNRLAVPESWDTSLQVPTLFKTEDKEGNKHLLMFTGLFPIRMSFSSDNGNTWTDLAPIGNFGGNVSFSDMIKLDNGDYMAFFHDDGRYIHGGNNEKITVEKTFAQNSDIYKIDIFKQHKNIDNWNKSEKWISCNPTIEDKYNWTKSKIIYESQNGAKATEDQSKIYKTISKNGGLTWSSPKEILSHPSAFLAEAAAIRSPNGKQIALIMRENTRRFNSFVSFSDDEGITWSKPKELSESLTGDRHCLKYTKDGRIFASFRDTAKNSKTFGDWVAWLGTYEDILHQKEGQCKIRLMKNYAYNHNEGDCGYSGVSIMPDNKVIAVSYGHFTEGQSPYIVSVKMNLNDTAIFEND